MKRKTAEELELTGLTGSEGSAMMKISVGSQISHDRLRTTSSWAR